MNLTIIGRVHSPLKNIEDCPRQEHEKAPGATIEVYQPYEEAARDIKKGDEIILLTWLNMADRSVLTTHPQNNPNAKLTGVFSTRSPDRPNPIGIHFVKITSAIHNNHFEVEALEVLDGTPVIDIKYGDLR